MQGDGLHHRTLAWKRNGKGRNAGKGAFASTAFLRRRESQCIPGATQAFDGHTVADLTGCLRSNTFSLHSQV